MKTILCYGDSNTFGYNPKTGGRYDYAVRWTGILQELLGADCRVIEEGLQSRTTCLEDPVYDDNKSGLALLPTAIKSHMPIDLCILMLGTNDLKKRFSMNACDIAMAIALLIRRARAVSADESLTGTPCKVLVISPIAVTPHMLSSYCSGEFGERALQVSAQLSAQIERTARELGAYYLDGRSITPPGDVDGLHLSPAGHTVMAQAIYQRVMEIFRA